MRQRKRCAVKNAVLLFLSLVIFSCGLLIIDQERQFQREQLISENSIAIDSSAIETYEKAKRQKKVDPDHVIFIRFCRLLRSFLGRLGRNDHFVGMSQTFSIEAISEFNQRTGVSGLVS